MPSARSKLLNVATRLVMRAIFRTPQTPAVYRRSLANLDLMQRKRLPVGITMEEVGGPVPGRWIRNDAASSPQTILYLHGGAFIMRLPEGHTVMVARMCAEAGVSAFMAWYRLAPEQPFPAAPDDCLSAYRGLLAAGHQARDIVVMGDSAGGNLALALLHLISRAGLPMPAGAVAISPITDFAQISASWRLNKRRDPMYRVQRFVNPIEHYVQGRCGVLDPVLSPYYGSYAGFPPLFFLVGGLEALLDDSIGMARKAIEQGVPAQVQVWQGMPHVFVLQEILPETRLARREIAHWLTALRKPKLRSTPLYRSCVEVFDVKSFTGVLRRETNDVYLDPAVVAP